MEMNEMISLLDAEGRALYAAARAAEPSARVRCCPDWTAVDLLAHHTHVLRWWADAVRTADPAVRPEPAPVVDPFDDYEAALAGFVGALADADPDTATFMWWKPAATVRGVARHQAQEVMLHRWDAQETAGLVPEPFAPAAALDGVAEFCEVVVPAWTDDPAPVVVAVAVQVEVAVEGAGRWILDGRGGTMSVTSGAAAAAWTGPVDAEIAGTPDEVVLALYGRVPLESLVVAGDPKAAATFHAAIDLD